MLFGSPEMLLLLGEYVLPEASRREPISNASRVDEKSTLQISKWLRSAVKARGQPHAWQNALDESGDLYLLADTRVEVVQAGSTPAEQQVYKGISTCLGNT